MPYLDGRAAALVAAMIATPAFADSYPVSGRWTYAYSSEKGPAKQCPAPRMEFRGERRFDSGGGVPDYRNVSMTRSGASEFRIVDEFNTGQINARLDYTLRLIDADHMKITLQAGPIIRLRRCT